MTLWSAPTTRIRRSHSVRARELIVDALQDLKNQGFDFSQLSSDTDDYVYALSVFYAGSRVNNWSQGLWPHSWALASPSHASPTKRFSDYQITDMGSQLTLRTFCHENGHMVCDFPDLYDYGSESNGVGHYCLMCYGGPNTNPTQVSAYLKTSAVRPPGIIEKLSEAIDRGVSQEPDPELMSATSNLPRCRRRSRRHVSYQDQQVS